MSRQLKNRSPYYRDIVAVITQAEAQTKKAAVIETIQFANKA